MRKGFTLVELLLTMGVVAILATISTISLVNYRSQKTLDLQTQEIVSVLRDTQNRSITQENGKPWGVHFKNLATSSGYYSLFANSTYNDSSIVSTTTLNSAVEFLDPAIGDSTDVAFSVITGRPTASSSITIALKSDSSISRTITISQNGLIAWSEGGGGGETLSIPSAPQSLSATPGNTQIVLNWSAPSSNGGSSITNYKVYRGTSSGSETLLTTLGNVLTYTNTGLTNGTTYYYKVSVVNTTSEGSQSSEASATPVAPSTVPSAPQSLSATPGNTQVVLNWSAPSSNGGSSITSYKVYRGTTPGGEGGTPITTLGNVLTYTNTSLTNGTTYYYKVSAVNSTGEGNLSSEASATPVAPLTVPTAPQSLSATTGNTQVILNWSAPSSNGGSSITNYKVYRGTSSGSETLLTTLGNVLTYTNTSLTNGTTYYYKVSAVNATGEGNLSSEASATPSAPFCTVDGDKDTHTTINGDVVYCDNSLRMWTPTADIGGSATTYVWGGDGTDEPTNSCIGIANRPACNYCDNLFYVGFNDWQLPTKDVLASFWTTACGGACYENARIAWDTNAYGTVEYWSSTEYSNPASAWYMGSENNMTIMNKYNVAYVRCVRGQLVAPSAPQSLTATTGNTQIVLNWSAPSSNGGSSITSYKVYRGTTSGGETLFTTLDNVLTYTNTSLTNGTTYYYKVSAVNATGEGTLSSEVSGVPSITPYVWVANSHDNTVTKLNGSTGATIGAYSVSNNYPTAIAVDVDNDNIWLATGYTIIRLRGSTGEALQAYTPGGTLGLGIAVDASGCAWVPGYSGNSVIKTCSNGGSIYSVGGFITNPYSVAVDASGNVWVTGWDSNNIIKLNNSGSLIGVYSAGDSPEGVAVDASGNIWVADNNGDTVTKLNGSTGATIGTYSVGLDPEGVAVDASGNVWVANWGDNNITKLNGSTGATIGTYSVGSDPLSFGDMTGFALQYFVLGRR